MPLNFLASVTLSSIVQNADGDTAAVKTLLDKVPKISSSIGSPHNLPLGNSSTRPSADAPLKANKTVEEGVLGIINLFILTFSRFQFFLNLNQ